MASAKATISMWLQTAVERTRGISTTLKTPSKDEPGVQASEGTAGRRKLSPVYGIVVGPDEGLREIANPFVEGDEAPAE